MLKRLSIFFFLTLFLTSSLTIFAKDMNDNLPGNISRENPVKLNLFDAADDGGFDAVGGKVYLGAQTSLAPAFVRQFYNTETTSRDRQHYTTPGRQIVYAGYYNAGCNYVYMNYTHRSVSGSTTLYFITYGVFEWSTGIWNTIDLGGPVNVSPNGSNTANIAVTPKEGFAVHSYHHGADANSPYYSHISAAAECLATSFQTDTLAGPPNTPNSGVGSNVNTGYCGDDNDILTPYVWPKVDVDTTSDGYVITHAAATEAGGCPSVPTDGIETSSIVYWRKVGTSSDPLSGTWEGPFFMDSVYVISPLVRAHPDNDSVFYVYLKPMYYYTGNTHPCEANGLGHYQITNEVVYMVSDDNGAPGSWSAPIYVTDFASGFENQKTEPAVYDISAMIDPNGVFHLVWSSGNRDSEDECVMYYASKMWHWDNSNNCISVAYDASHPALFVGDVGAWNIPIAKHNISWCDDNLYISFTRFGGHPVGDTSFDAGLGDGINFYQNGDIFVVGSDASGGMGKTWTDGIDLTDTESEDCAAGDCFSEHWPTMAMYSTDSLMIEYIEDKDPGAFGTNDEGTVATDNPVMFLTWPCFSMADVGSNVCLTLSPADPNYPEIALAPSGSSGCTVPFTYQDTIIMQNCGNADLNYTTSSNAAWLTITSGASGNISAGTGPRGADEAGWSGAPGCASPATLVWKANSSALSAGGYTGAITVDIDNAAATDFDITVNLIIACNYYIPEYSTITGGCWTVDVWNTPQAGNGSDNTDGNMRFYTCGEDSTLHPLYTEAFIVGWTEGSTVYCYTDNSDDHMGIQYGRTSARMRALSGLELTTVGSPASGQGHYKSEGYWCTPDSLVKGIINYYIPGNQDTSVIVEKITLWNESGSDLNDFLVGEGIDWDIRRDSNFDQGGVDIARKMVYQLGAGADDSIVAGVSPYFGYDGNFGAAVLPNQDWIYPDTGFNVVDIYNYLTALDGNYSIFSDSNTDLNSVYRFWEGTLGVNDTLELIKIKAVSINGVAGLQTIIDKGIAFIGSNAGIYAAELSEPPGCISLTHTLTSKNATLASFPLEDVNDKPIKWSGVETDPDGWLEITPTQGVTPTSLNISYNATVANGLAEGLYEAHFIITAPAATNSPVDICVELTVTAGGCVGICGDANGDATVNVSDAVYIINYVFVGGGAPVPLACGDANSDGTVNVSDAVYIINYVFVGGGAPDNCSPGSVNWTDGDCCPFQP
jgi:hypothetical protein